MTPDYCDIQIGQDCNNPEHTRLQAVESNSQESTRDILVNTICADLVPQDAVGHFLRWFIDAFRALDLVITGQQDSSRLACQTSLCAALPPLANS